MDTHLTTELVPQAPNMAIWQRRPAAVTHPKGSEYLGNTPSKRPPRVFWTTLQQDRPSHTLVLTLGRRFVADSEKGIVEGFALLEETTVEIVDPHARQILRVTVGFSRILGTEDSHHLRQCGTCQRQWDTLRD